MPNSDFKDSLQEEFSIPTNISDILKICKEFSNLGYKIQSQIENMIEFGVEESIKTGTVKSQSLPYIKSFLQEICSNPYFGDAILEAEEAIFLIDEYENSKIRMNLN